MRNKAFKSQDSIELIRAAISHLAHLLPGQAPIQDFVHHNTLHGYQHLPFEQALAEAERTTDINAYLPDNSFRAFYRQGRITDDDLNAAFATFPHLQAGQSVCELAQKNLNRQAIYQCALLFDFDPVSTSHLNWLIEEQQVLSKLQTDVPPKVRQVFLAGEGDESEAVSALWDIISITLGLAHAGLHCEALLELSPEQVEDWLVQAEQGASAHELTQQQARLQLQALLDRVGADTTLRGFVQALSGIDILDSVRPQLIRIFASCMDEGVAAWHFPPSQQGGVYAAWRATLPYDANLFLQALPDWQQTLNELPDDALAAIAYHLTELGIAKTNWENYLQRLALELPGWSGLINWRQQHPDYRSNSTIVPELADYLAIRLTLDKLWLNQVCRDIWKVEANVDALRGYFSKNLSELLVRERLYQGNLPEYLVQKAEALIIRSGSERNNRADWQQLADLIQTWLASPLAQCQVSHSTGNSVWRLFRLCQHLGLGPSTVAQLEQSDLQALLSVLDGFTSNQRSPIWLAAYERHYREELFHVLRANHRRGRWASREQRPEAQIVFCMDEREESFRRHLEALNPAIETLGAAGFFGVAMHYQGWQDAYPAALCPVVVTPVHQVNEAPRADAEAGFARLRTQWCISQQWADFYHHGLRRQVLLSQLLMNMAAPFVLLNLLGKALIPKHWHDLRASITKRLMPDLPSEVQVTAQVANGSATPSHPQSGFTDSEQADRVAGFLRTIGLTHGFAPLVVLMGHGSSSLNNPHRAAYDCGACSGRHGGPNARVFAAMANRPQVRGLLSARGIVIPDDTWFIGAEHNTCNETISWYDLQDLPAQQQAAFSGLNQQLAQIRQQSAHERCRRLASAPRNPSLKDALFHIEERALDFSQVRPELGHATNAAAVIGRRSVTQGTFLDRRVFLISYDASQDADGQVLEAILLAVGSVGSGINLEYYFSTVNNEHLGCGTKVAHNVIGFFAVMEGASSDLRTGLPKQMVEIHEAMRLQIIVEAKTTVLERIYAEQPGLQELIAGGWVHLGAIHPDTGELSVFERGKGFTPWLPVATELPVSANSLACYAGHSQPVPPQLLNQPMMQVVL
ncbi:DUF2309 domain-containing protein [Methylosoma difficile]